LNKVLCNANKGKEVIKTYSFAVVSETWPRDKAGPP